MAAEKKRYYGEGRRGLTRDAETGGNAAASVRANAENEGVQQDYEEKSAGNANMTENLQKKAEQAGKTDLRFY